VVGGNFGLTISMAAMVVIRDTGAKSFTGSKRRLRYRLALMPCVPLVPYSSV
jgi:hypothetical protein